MFVTLVLSPDKFNTAGRLQPFLSGSAIVAGGFPLQFFRMMLLEVQKEQPGTYYRSALCGFPSTIQGTDVDP